MLPRLQLAFFLAVVIAPRVAASDYPRPPVGSEWELLQAEWALVNEAWSLTNACAQEKRPELERAQQQALLMPFLLTMEQGSALLEAGSGPSKKPPKDCSVALWQIDRVLAYLRAKAEQRTVSGPPLPK